VSDWLRVLERLEILEQDDWFEEMPRDLDTSVASAEVYATTPELGVEVAGLYPEDDFEDLVLLCRRRSGFSAKFSRQKSKLEALPFDRAPL
jgi:hypothetical protein